MSADLEGLLEEIGVRIGRETDDEIFGYCPGHKENLGREDRSPRTWSVNRATGNHHCFACGYGGTLPELVMEHGKLGYWGALKLLRDFEVDLADPDDLPTTYHDRGGKKAKVSKPLADDALAQFELPPDKELRRRKISAKAAAYYDIGWDPDIKCWITPIKLLGGQVLGWQAKNKRMFDNYPEGVTKQVTCFGIDRFEAGETAVLVESPLDVAHAYTEGFDGFLSSYGVGVSDEQMRLILSLTDRLVLALDHDDDGRAWTRRLITGDRGPRKPKGVAWGAKFDLHVINYSRTDAKDPGEMTGDEIEWALENAMHSSEWLATPW